MAYVKQVAIGANTYDIKATADAEGNIIASTYVKKSLGTAAGDLMYWSGSNSPTVLHKGSDGQALMLDNGTPSWGTISTTDTKNTTGSTNNTTQGLYLIGAPTQDANPQTYSHGSIRMNVAGDGTTVEAGSLRALKVYNAVWNDYAEYRTYLDGEIPFGKVVCENGDDTISISKNRMQLGAMICSDTFGTCMGDYENGIPIAVAGRVLAYPFEPRENYVHHIGEAVCAGPNGTVSIMTKEEAKEYPECIVGYISAVPDYEEWGTVKVKVNGRVWIKVK